MGEKVPPREAGSPLETPAPYEELKDDLSEFVELLEGKDLRDKKLSFLAESINSIKGSNLYKSMVQEPLIERFLALWETKRLDH
ncbi:MAG TPA: hypothetical protein VI953_01335 [Candidatus Paceibacterota bacterium]